MASASSSAIEPQAQSASGGLVPWVAALFVGCAVAWFGYNFPPVDWRIPDDMTHIGALSPPEDQAKLKAVETANKWKNTLLKFSLAGLGIGLCGVLVFATSLGKNGSAAGITLLAGLVAGALSGTISLVVRQYLDLEYPIPLISEQMRPLFCDTVVFGIGSAILLFPVSAVLWMRNLGDDRHKAVSVPLAGLLTGLIVPVLSASVLSAQTDTSFFPPRGLDLSMIWFAVLAIVTLAMLAMAGKKRAATVAPAVN